MLSREQHERASRLFIELRDVAEPERRSRLTEAAAGSGELVREVMSLWEYDLGGGEAAGASAPGPSDPACIGPYRVVQRIGRGGSGLVLLAEQSEPVRRRVAIKIVPHAAVSPEFAARFEFERRALERTEHPNIARILDAGRTADGLPYLVMEYVDGEPITRFCRERGLGLAARIGLMIDVADAVQHAHQRGVIHRDLKPANILVSDTSGRVMARVLDFGIAKPVPSEGMEIVATSGLPLGTPAYMAPEQTGGRPVDTRADVYALGAVMHELACGKPPVEVGDDPLEALRRIRETDPVAASRVRARDGVLARESVARAMLPDLDRVLGKALEKEPSRRYQTAAAFAEDLGRVLRREPVVARPATMRYRAARFVQRNRALTASLAAVGAAVVLGMAGLSAGMIEAQRQRAEAMNQGEAQREINRFLTDDLLGAASPEREGDKVTALDLLHKASGSVDERLADRPLIAAAIHHTLGTAYTQLGAFDDADRHLTRAVELRRAAAGPDAPDTVRSEVAAASLLGQRQKYAEAAPALERVVERARRLLGPDDPALYAALNDLGVVYESLDRGPAGVEALNEALAGRERLLGAHDAQVLVTMSNLAQAYDRVGDSKQSLGLLVRALGVADAMRDPPRMVVLGLCNNIGATLQDQNRDAEAKPYLERAARLASDWLGPESPDTLTIRANLAGLETELGDPLRGAGMYREVAAGEARALGAEAQGTLTARYGIWDSLWHAKHFEEAATGLAELLPDVERALGEKHWLATQTRLLLAHALADGGHPERALPLAERAASEFSALYGPDHAKTKPAVAVVAALKAKLSPSASAAGPRE